MSAFLMTTLDEEQDAIQHHSPSISDDYDDRLLHCDISAIRTQFADMLRFGKAIKVACNTNVQSSCNPIPKIAAEK